MLDVNLKENRAKIIEMLKEVTLRFNNIRDELCEPYGLSSLQAIIILDIYHNPRKTNVTDICKRLNKLTNTISPLINRLVEKGYLIKEKDKKDSRITKIKLSEKSRDIADKISVDLFDYTYPMFDAVTQEEFDKLYESLLLLLRSTEDVK